MVYVSFGIWLEIDTALSVILVPIGSQQLNIAHFSTVYTFVYFWTTLWLAIRAFRRSNHPGLVLAVQRIQGIEDEFLLSGYVAMLLKEYDQAQELFLASSRPTAALEVRIIVMEQSFSMNLSILFFPLFLSYIFGGVGELYT